MQSNRARRIRLTKGKFARVDASEFEALSSWKWLAEKDGRVWYARRRERTGGRHRSLSMHRFILKVNGGIIDHINGDGLDNRAINLRVVTPAQSQRNLRGHLRSTSKFKGVSWCLANRKWMAAICVNGHRKYLGYFHDEENAAHVYDAAASKYFGEFSRLNFPIHRKQTQQKEKPCQNHN